MSTSTSSNNKELARRFYNSVINERNLQWFDDCVAADFVDRDPDPGQKASRKGTKTMFRGMFEAFPDMRMHIDSMVAEGDLVGVWMTVTGTHRGTFAGVEPTGRTITVTGCDWIRFRDGKAAERWGVFDTAGMMAQLGIMPAPSASELKARSKKYYETMTGAKGDLATIRNEYLHPQHRIHFSGQPHPLDTDGLQQLLSGFWSAFPDLTQTVENQICEGNTVFNRITVNGTHRGEFAGVPPTNKKVSAKVMTAQVYQGDKIVEQRVQVDMVSVLAQIGAIKQPA